MRDVERRQLKQKRAEQKTLSLNYNTIIGHLNCTLSRVAVTIWFYLTRKSRDKNKRRSVRKTKENIFDRIHVHTRTPPLLNCSDRCMKRIRESKFSRLKRIVWEWASEHTDLYIYERKTFCIFIFLRHGLIFRWTPFKMIILCTTSVQLEIVDEYRRHMDHRSTQQKRICSRSVLP